ncbi:MAG: OB-fold nucleic acid binding domain-containing protein, partial [Pseudomonadota bacterium]|nr:OB-fold nucleic acid binding domain-containing protein [Pseudomonadota bacterium]
AEHVISDYQTVRLSLKAHPMHFLRSHYGERGFVTAEQLASIRDGKRLSIAGVVLIRQRPGTSKGVVFITIEDETGVANLVIWPAVFERQRKIVMGARLMAVQGIVQKDGDSEVIHVVARTLEDQTHMLQHLSDDMLLPTSLEKRDSAGSWGRPPNRHPRDVEIIPKSRDFH